MNLHQPLAVALPQQFKRHGYHAVSMGKIYHGGFDDARSWSEKALRPTGASRYAREENRALIARKRKAARAKGLKELHPIGEGEQKAITIGE